MRIAVLGATGGTGRLVVDQALARGHSVTALARDPQALAPRAGAAVIVGAVSDAAAVGQVVSGSDAVVSVLGGSGRAPTCVYSDGVAAALAAGARRLVAVSAVPVTPPAIATAVERRVVFPALHLFFGGSYDDMRRMEVLLADSDVDWTVVRPPRLTDAAATGGYRLAEQRLPRARSIPRADLAGALLDVIADPATVRRAVAVAT